jgi:MFS transporter, ACS family, D-galactonate transporter
MTEAHPVRVRMSRRELTIVLLLVASVVINYVDRINLSMAMPLIERQFTLSPLQIGSLLAAFFWTYALLQVLGLVGWLSDRFQPGWVLFYGFLMWTVVTGLTGLTTSFAALFLLRLMLGAGESVAYPCYSRIFAGMPQQHRGRANALIDAGTKLGPAAGAFFGGLVLVHLGWRMLFVAFGAGGLLWLAPWWKAMPRVEENSSQASASGFLESRHSIVRILKLKCAWGTFIGHFSGNYFYYFLLAWLPHFLVEEEHLSVRSMSRLTSALFFLIGCSTLIAGWISDRLIARGMSPSVVRRAVAAGGLAVAACLLGTPLVDHSQAASLALLAISCIGYGAFSSNHWAITQTLAGPAMAGRWSSLQNGVANFSGIAAPWVAGLVLEAEGNSRLAFTIAGTVALVGALAWGVLVDRVEQVNWEEV